MTVKTDPQAVAESLLHVLPLFNRFVSTKLREKISDETTLSQLRAIKHLKDQPITLSELAERRSVTRQAASLQVQGMVEKGWVRRLPDASDRRQAQLEVTDEGMAHWLEAHQLLVDQLAERFEALTAEEFAAVEAALPALDRVLAQLAPERAPAVAANSVTEA